MYQHQSQKRVFFLSLAQSITKGNKKPNYNKIKINKHYLKCNYLQGQFLGEARPPHSGVQLEWVFPLQGNKIKNQN